ncbi:MAG TPA: carboxypeptidase regulatory-like domain-containing protein [Longimicrobium sp.]|nr:carboxypeptidase regulatory-like domain-containing protein [Longimicrobium sp.]
MRTPHPRLAAACAAAAALACIVGSTPAAAQAGTTELVVTVVEQGAQKPVAGAQVELLAAGRSGVADSAGVARLHAVAAGPVYLEVRKLGYASVRFALTLAANDTVAVEVELRQAPVQLAGIVATAEYRRRLTESGFYARRRRGIGGFLSREEFGTRGYGRFSDVVRRMPSVLLSITRDGRAVVSPKHSVFAAIGRKCNTAVYLDGRLLRYNPETDNLDQLIPYSDIEAVETYSAAETPGQYITIDTAGCGALLVWTRNR